VNGPENTVISGPRGLLEEIQAALGKGGIGGRWLGVSHAFHSPLVEPMLEAFEGVAGGVKYEAPRIGW
jgi:acyl transferase domain-containing protein